MFLDFKVKEISHAKEGTSTGTELPASYYAARAQPQSGIPRTIQNHPKPSKTIQDTHSTKPHAQPQIRADQPQNLQEFQNLKSVIKEAVAP